MKSISLLAPSIAFVLLGQCVLGSVSDDPYSQFFGESSTQDDRAIWDFYKKSFGKKYPTLREDEFRYNLWMDNYEYVRSHNQKVLKGEGSFLMSVNDFCDQTSEELSRSMYGLKLDPFSKKELRQAHDKNERKKLKGRFRFFNLFAKSRLPKSINWVEKGFVSSVKDQGKCGACWSFVTTGILESHLMIKKAKEDPTDYSEQNLMDCSTDYGNQGCDGGLMSQAFEYIADTGGVVLDDNYKYLGKVDQCKYDKMEKSMIPVNVSHYKKLPISESVLKKYVALKGPIAVGIDGNHKSFILYKSGIYYDPKCSSTGLNHAVLVVGYGTSDEGKDYWLIKNSWGTKWGENGYGKIARNRENHCGIASLAGYPVFKDD